MLTPRRCARAAVVLTLASATALTGAVTATAGSGPAPGAPGAGDGYFPLQGNGGYDVRDYDAALRFDPSTQRLHATATITATATQALSQFDLDLRGLTVTGVSVSGVPATFRRSGQELVITPRTPLQSGRGFTTTVAYEGVPAPVTDPDGSIEGWVATADGAVAVGEPQGTPSWLPSNDSPRDKATFTFRVTVPTGTTAVANGVLQSTTTSGGWTTSTWRQAQPISTYLATVTTGRFDVVTGTSPGGVPYYLASDPRLTPKAKNVLAKTPAIVDWFSSVFGPYPFSIAGGIVDDAPDVGYSLECATKPVYAYAPDELTVAHELAHQWFGDDVTLSRWQDIWLNEGFAEFSSWLWSEHTGQVSAQQFFDRYYAKPASDTGFWDPAPGNPGEASQIFATSVYERGAMTLQALRVKLGDGVFFDVLRSWLAARPYGNGRVEDFIALAEQRSGRELTSFFDAWLYSPGKPTAW